MRSPLSALVALAALTAAPLAASGCQQDPTPQIKESLAKDGLTDIQVAPSKKEEGLYLVTGVKGKAQCEGTARIVARVVESDVKCKLPAAAKPAPKPVDPLEADCEGGDASACYELGKKLVEAPPGERDLPKARALQDKACKAGNDKACTALGELKSRGLGGPVEPKAAMELFTAACERGELGACARQARLLHVDRKFKEAKPLFEKACAGGEPLGCNGVATYLRDGVGGKVSPKKARELFDQVCEEGLPESCANLGIMLVKGQGGPKDLARGKELLAKACEDDISAACIELKHMKK